LIALRLSDFLLISEVHEVSLFSIVIDVILAYPLTDDVRVPIEIVQFDFVQEEV